MEDQLPLIILLVYLSIIVEILFLPVPSIASTYQLLNSRELSGVLKRKTWKNRLSLIVPTLLNIITFLIPLSLIIIPKLETYLFPLPIRQVYLGLFIMLAGRAIGIIAVLQIRKQSHLGEEPNRLHTTGFYCKTRNPIIIGMHMTIIGLFLLFPSIIFLLGIVFYINYMHFKLLKEEQFLLNKFGKSYQEYCKNVNRYI